MKIFSTPEFKVGLLVLIVGAVIAALTIQVSEDPSYMGKAKKVYFSLEDATGLVKDSSVYVAGIQVGIIKDINLKNGKAMVEVSMKGDVELYESALVEIRPNGILGDKNIVINPGDSADPKLADGGTITRIKDSASIEKVIEEVGKVAESIKITAEHLRKAAEGDRETALGRIILNIESLSANLSDLTQANKDKVSDIVDRVDRISDTLDEFVNSDGEEGFKAGWADARESLRRIEKVAKNLDDITTKVNNGEGTIGKLINDETTVDQINVAITNVNGFLGGLTQMQTTVDFNSWYLSKTENFKSFLGVKIQPGLDRYYLIQVVDDPEGLSQSRNIETSINGGATAVENRTEIFKNRVKFTALFAKNFFNFTLKGGVIENTGGFGFDYFILPNQSLRLTAEAYDLGNFRLRSYLRYDFFKGFYLNGGINDALSGGKRKSEAFLGAGLFLTNDDIKALMTRITF